MSIANSTGEGNIYQRPEKLLQNLIHFNTSNPPGNEKACIDYIKSLINEVGIEATVLARDPERPNLIARLSGHGNEPPLLLYGHVDVATTEKQTWKHAPFGGDLAEGYIWGRGALDMKGGVAMMLAAFMRAKVEEAFLPGDIILAILSDEEAGGDFGAKYLVENHADQFESVRYAIGEFGGFSFYVGKQKFYPIMVAEKKPCDIEVIVRGSSGHPTTTVHGGAMAKLGEVLKKLDENQMPVHITTATRLMIESMSSALPFPSSLALRQLLRPGLTNTMLKVFGKQLEQFESLLHNNSNAYAIVGADFKGRIPDEITLHVICNLLPGYTPDDGVSGLRQILGSDVEIKVLDARFYEEADSEPDMGLFDVLADILQEADPDSKVTPLLLPSPTDGRLFSRLGIQTYGFLPMNLPQGLNFWELIHAPDERIPVEAIAFGAEAIYKLLQSFGRDHQCR